MSQEIMMTVKLIKVEEPYICHLVCIKCKQPESVDCTNISNWATFQCGTCENGSGEKEQEEETLSMECNCNGTMNVDEIYNSDEEEGEEEQQEETVSMECHSNGNYSMDEDQEDEEVVDEQEEETDMDSPCYYNNYDDGQMTVTIFTEVHTLYYYKQ